MTLTIFRETSLVLASSQKRSGVRNLLGRKVLLGFSIPRAAGMADALISSGQTKEIGVLKITKTAVDGRPALTVEGNLAGPWVDEVSRAWAESESAVPRPALDLSGVTFADSAGARLLRDLIDHGVEIAACSSFVAELLKPEVL